MSIKWGFPASLDDVALAIRTATAIAVTMNARDAADRRAASSPYQCIVDQLGWVSWY
jgi:hypothetical protein